VAEARKNVLTRDEIKAVADGRILTGEEARKVKLVDSVGYMTDAYNKTLDLARLKSAKVIRYQKSSGLFDNMFMGPTPSLELTYLAELVLKTNSSQFMYLWTPEMIGK
jgi:protease-4